MKGHTQIEEVKKMVQKGTHLPSADLIFRGIVSDMCVALYQVVTGM